MPRKYVRKHTICQACGVPLSGHRILWCSPECEREAYAVHYIEPKAGLHRCENRHCDNVAPTTGTRRTRRHRLFCSKWCKVLEWQLSLSDSHSQRLTQPENYKFCANPKCHTPLRGAEVKWCSGKCAATVWFQAHLDLYQQFKAQRGRCAVCEDVIDFTGGYRRTPEGKFVCARCAWKWRMVNIYEKHGFYHVWYTIPGLKHCPNCGHTVDVETQVLHRCPRK